MEACKSYIQSGGRRITFEYAMIADVNDTKESAQALCKLLKGIQCHENLNPMNNIPGSEYSRSKPEDVERFTKKMTDRGIEVTVRRELGRDISAACGQLRRSETKEG